MIAKIGEGQHFSPPRRAGRAPHQQQNYAAQSHIKKSGKSGLFKEHETGFEPEAEALFYIGFKVSCDISCDTLKYAILNRNFCDEHMP